jgi:hypothetical protein
MRQSFAAPSAVTLAAVASALLAGVAAATEQPNTCIAGKLACTNAFTSAVFKCYAKVFKSGFTGANGDKAEECVRKARRKFGTAVSDKVQCWDKIEGKEKAAKPETVCPANIVDEFDVDALVEDFTLDIVSNEVAPGGPVPFGSSCSAGKVGCVATFFQQLFKCEIAAHKAGAVTDQACIDKAITKFSGGANPAKGCFAKLEAKQKLSKLKTLCDATGNTAVAGGKAEAFVALVTVGLEP